MYASYLRVSTARQGASGLGLQAQREMVSRYLKDVDGELEREFVEVRSGKGGAARPVLDQALNFCRKHKCRLLVGKLDRLSRSLFFIAGLIEKKVPFTVVEHPEASTLELQLRAMISEEERRKIGERTRAALAIVKARGTRLGNPRLHLLNRPRHEEARAYAESLRPRIQKMQRKGLSQRAMLAELEKDSTYLGAPWKLVKLQRVLKRLAEPMPVKQPGVVATGQSTLTALRKEAGLSQRELARLSGVNQAQISRAETGGHHFKLELAEKLAKVLGCLPTVLM